MIRLSEYVIKFLAKEKIKHVFMVSGGGGMFLIDSLGRSKDIQYVCNHHEQACAMSAEGYQRVTGNLGAALVTTGPAGTNVITGLMCSWNDSIPVIIISGQVASRFLIGNTGLRQRGTHEANITKIVESITKYAVTVTDAGMIRYHLEKALYLARHGRPGPVWLDIPLDIQAAMINEDTLAHFSAEKENFIGASETDETKIKEICGLLSASKRPVIIAGNGIRIAGMQEEFIRFIETYRIPVVTTKLGFDLIYDEHELLAGRIGTYGQRAGNFAVQNADFVLVLGSRLAFTTIGYQTEWFARGAKKVVVDIDQQQLKYPNIKIDISVRANLKDFFPILNKALKAKALSVGDWISCCQNWRKKYPAVLPQWRKEKKYVNPYYFFEALSEKLGHDDIVITDQGATFYCSTPAFKLKKGQRLFTNGGFSPMGFGLPAAIGACFANNKKRVICVHGDGGLELNIQELQTIVHYKLPVKLFVFNNQGYLSIKHTQNAYFNGFFVGSDPSSGVSCPDTVKIARAYGIASLSIKNHKQMHVQIRKALKAKGAMIIDVTLHPMQPFAPRVISERKSSGVMVSKPLEDMYPFLNRKEFLSNMIVAPVEDKN
ncbi:MAG: thiamine pyrophosphate-binding protein [Candidatus Omnitrophica bacterium]|nr:thiamine pyrophosphate-binding protein [Candidatus Omnitrophota bacterium]